MSKGNPLSKERRDFLKLDILTSNDNLNKIASRNACGIGTLYKLHDELVSEGKISNRRIHPKGETRNSNVSKSRRQTVNIKLDDVQLNPGLAKVFKRKKGTWLLNDERADIRNAILDKIHQDVICDAFGRSIGTIYREAARIESDIKSGHLSPNCRYRPRGKTQLGVHGIESFHSYGHKSVVEDVKPSPVVKPAPVSTSSHQSAESLRRALIDAKKNEIRASLSAESIEEQALRELMEEI